MDEVRKLKRGLKDISTLFSEKAGFESGEKPIARNILPDASIQLISLSHPGLISSFDLCRAAAEQASAAGYPSSIVSIGCQGEPEGASALKGSWVKHRHMDLSEFEKNCSCSSSGRGEMESSLMFLDFSWHNAGVFEKAVGLLDKTVFWVTPEMENLSEVYKWIKWALQRNARLECLLAYDGLEEKTGAYLYEKLSEMVSRHLGCDLGWFGCHPVSRGGFHGIPAFDLELLISHDNFLMLSEKQALSHSLRAS